MHLRVWPLALIATLLLAAGLVAACGGGDDDDGNGGGSGEPRATPMPMTLEEYFTELEELAVEFDEEGAELDERFAAIEEATSDEDALKAAEDAFSEGLNVLEEFVEGLGTLNPPPEVESAHSEAVAAGAEAVEVFDQITREVRNADTIAEVEASLTEAFDVGGPFERFSDSCFGLQDVADTNGVEVDLRCG